MNRHASVKSVLLGIGLTFGILNTLTADLVFVSNGDGNEVLRFDEAGGRSVYANSGFAAAEQLQFDAQGNLWVNSYWNHSLLKIGPGGSPTTIMAKSSLVGPVGLAIDNAGRVYVADRDANQIKRFDSAGNMSVFASGLVGPYGLAFDRLGNLFVANEYNNTIWKFDPLGNGSLFASAGLNQPVGLALDSHGNLFVSNARINNILKFDSSGNSTVFATSFLSNPVGLAVDSQDNVYAANWVDGTVSKYGPSGTGSVFASGFHHPTFITTQVVPEPSALAVLILGAGAFFLRRQARS